MSSKSRTERDAYVAELSRLDAEGVQIDQLAYEGRADCKDPLCRQIFTMKDDKAEGRCIGWHCAVCGGGSSQYGHRECIEATIQRSSR